MKSSIHISIEDLALPDLVVKSAARSKLHPYLGDYIGIKCPCSLSRLLYTELLN